MVECVPRFRRGTRHNWMADTDTRLLCMTQYAFPDNCYSVSDWCPRFIQFHTFMTRIESVCLSAALVRVG